MSIDEELKKEIKEIFRNKELSFNNILEINKLIKDELGIQEKKPIA